MPICPCGSRQPFAARGCRAQYAIRKPFGYGCRRLLPSPHRVRNEAPTRSGRGAFTPFFDQLSTKYEIVNRRDGSEEVWRSAEAMDVTRATVPPTASPLVL